MMTFIKCLIGVALLLGGLLTCYHSSQVWTGCLLIGTGILVLARLPAPPL